MLKLYATLILTLSGHLLGFGQTYFLQRQTNSIYVAFSDQALSASVKEAIVADLSICFQGWATNAEIIVREKGESAGYMDYGTRNPYYRDGVIFPKNIITNATGGIALQIPQSLSDAYTNALAFVAANSNIVAAAYEFVAFVSSSNFVAISSNALPNYILQKNTTTNEIIADAQETISELRHQTYYPPSILGFQYSDRGPAATNLWMLVPCSISLSYTDAKGWHAFPAIWHDGKWKFCIWQD